MSLQNALLTLLMGPTIPKPVPPSIIESLQNVEVTHDDSGRSGFQITFETGRSGPACLVDTACHMSSQIKPFSRVVIIVTFNAKPRVLMDGVITNIEYSPDSSGGPCTFSVTGEDVSVMMDLEERSVEHVGQSEFVIANKLILSYADLGLIPMVIAPSAQDIPMPIERVPFQHGTDLGHLNRMAERFGYVFYIIPGPVPLANTAYWGPPVRIGLPQKALSVNLGHATNIVNINFSYNALSATKVEGILQDRKSNKSMSVRAHTSHRTPPLVSTPALTASSQSRMVLARYSGLTVSQAQSQAQGTVDSSVDGVAAASGELDVLRYGNILWPRLLVGLRGAGYKNDGLWYVKKVTHKIKRGEYRQSFTLTREGMGSSIPKVNA
jgi:hypothetical protein